MTLWVASFTIVLKIAIVILTNWIGQETKNAAVIALAYDHRNDIFAAIAAAIGIALGRIGYLWVDPLAGALVALFILRTGIEILRESSDDLMDTVPGKTLSERIIRLVQPIPGVQQIEEIHAHRFGPYLVINMTIGVDGRIQVREGDKIACKIEQTLYQDVKLLRRVFVHYHPADLKQKGTELICNPTESEHGTAVS